MIEVEKKFILTAKQKERLLKGAEFVSEEIFTDIYYDTTEYALTKNDIWLRLRGDNFELKIPAHENANAKVQSYTEIEGEENIRQIFNLLENKTFLEDMQVFGYGPFCVCTTTRKKYKKYFIENQNKEKFSIDLDEVDYADFQYVLAEIELMVESKAEMQKATKKIMAFAKSVGLRDMYVRGKVLEYLRRKKPEHFQALVEAGVVKER